MSLLFLLVRCFCSHCFPLLFHQNIGSEATWRVQHGGSLADLGLYFACVLPDLCQFWLRLQHGCKRHHWYGKCPEVTFSLGALCIISVSGLQSLFFTISILTSTLSFTNFIQTVRTTLTISLQNVTTWCTVLWWLLFWCFVLQMACFLSFYNVLLSLKAWWISCGGCVGAGRTGGPCHTGGSVVWWCFCFMVWPCWSCLTSPQCSGS